MDYFIIPWGVKVRFNLNPLNSLTRIMTFFGFKNTQTHLDIFKTKKATFISDESGFRMWAMRDSNPRPPRCKRGALNQLS